MKDPNWIEISAIATAAAALAAFIAAIVTGIMAIFTRRLAVETGAVAVQTRALAAETTDMVAASSDERAQAERHHQQLLCPIVILTASCRISDSNVSDGGGRANLRPITFEGSVTNIGSGPALATGLRIDPESYPGRKAILGPFRSGQSRSIRMTWEVSDPGTPSRHLPFKCVLQFNSLFFTRGAVFQSSITGKGTDIVTTDIILPSPEEDEKAEAVVNERFPGTADTVYTPYA